MPLRYYTQLPGHIPDKRNPQVHRSRSGCPGIPPHQGYGHLLRYVPLRMPGHPLKGGTSAIPQRISPYHTSAIKCALSLDRIPSPLSRTIGAIVHACQRWMVIFVPTDTPGDRFTGGLGAPPIYRKPRPSPHRTPCKRLPFPSCTAVPLPAALPRSPSPSASLGAVQD